MSAKAEKDAVVSVFLHVPSLLIAAAVAGGCVSASHLLIWRAGRNEAAVLLWGTAYGVATLAMTMVGLRGQIPPFLSIVVGNSLLLLAFGLVWLGYRRFIGKSGRGDRLFTLLGAIVWFAFAGAPQLFSDINLRVQVVSAVQFVYLLAIAFDLFAHSRKEPLPALLLTVGVIGVQEVLLVTRIVYLQQFPIDPAFDTLPTGLPIGLTLIGSTAFIVFFGLLQLALVGQRSERRFRVAAETDGLTGLANRRRFLNDVLPRLAASPDRGALVLFDLDHFKRINDSHGHLMGDRALVEFAGILANVASGQAIAARVGGEEFALFFPDADTATAADLAEGVRRLTGAYRLRTPSGALRVTVSGGVAGVADIGPDYESLHSAADTALYAAKREGRDRIAVHRRNLPAPQLTLAAAV